MALVILLPGLACDAALWREQVPALRGAGHDVEVVDVHTRFSTLPEMAAALLREHPGPLWLAGSSMGGMLALEVCAQAPGRVHAIALLGTTARADTPEMVKLRTEAIGLFEQGRADEVILANVAYALHESRHHDDALIHDYLAMTRRAGAAQLIAQNRAVIARRDYRSLLPSIACPVLVACGDSDLLTPPALSREIAAAVPRAHLALLPRCGHLLTWERPAEVNELLLGWLEGRLTAAPPAG
jgi:pimeloyl-ACP methyl ester carboxylesterase